MPTVLYAGGSDGVSILRSDDGQSWSNCHAPVPPLDVTCLEILPSHPQVILAGTRGDGVWRSDDNGATFFKPSYGRRGPGKVWCLTLDPVDHNRVYAGCEPIDLYVSDDLGANWERVESLRAYPTIESIGYPVPFIEPHLRDIAIPADDPSTIYAALQVGGILRSFDQGKTWDQMVGSFDEDVHTFAIDPNDSQHIAIATGGDEGRRGQSEGKALFNTRDGGKSWNALATDLPHDYAVPYVLKPNEPTTAFAGLGGGNPIDWASRPEGACGALLRTLDDGATWQELDLTAVPDASKYVVMTLAANAHRPDEIYGALANGELFGTADGGDSWAPLGITLSGTKDLRCLSA